MNAGKNSLSTIQAVIFDLDGVLVWSIPIHYEAYRQTFATEGKKFTYDDYVRLGSGVSRDVLIQRVMGKIPPEKLAEMMTIKEQHVRDCLGEEGLESVPGARDFVLDVQQRGLKTAVATASRSPHLFLVAAGMAELFDLVVDRTQVVEPKPHPEIYYRAAKAVDLEPGSCIAIEDSPPGVEAGLAAGMHVLALTTTHQADELRKAHRIFAGFEEIDLGEWLK